MDTVPHVTSLVTGLVTGHMSQIRSFVAWRERKKENERCTVETKRDCLLIIIISLTNATNTHGAHIGIGTGSKKTILLLANI